MNVQLPLADRLLSSMKFHVLPVVFTIYTDFDGEGKRELALSTNKRLMHELRLPYRRNPGPTLAPAMLSRDIIGQ